MKQRRYPCVVVATFAWLLAIWLCGLAGCSNQYSTPGGAPAPSSRSSLGGKKMVTVDSTPSSALIKVNGMVKGAAPVDIEVEVDDLGDVAVDVDLTADFSDSPSSSKAALSSTASYHIDRGEKPPSVIRFDPDGASAH